MAIPTSYTEFVAGLAALAVTGLKRNFTEPPASIGSADLPAMWPGLPRGSEPALTFKTAGGWPVLTCDLVIATEAKGQGTQMQNYAGMLTIMDNLSTALRATKIGRATLTWTMTANVLVEVAGTTYWAVIATIDGR